MEESSIRYPAKWIFISAGVLLSLVLLVCVLSPSIRFSLITGWEVRSLIRFRDRFKPENYDIHCPNYRIYQAGACVRDLLTEERRLKYASMTARIYYLSTMVNATDLARAGARTVQDQVEATLNLLEYLNDEMKLVLLRTGGEVDLSPLDSHAVGSGLAEDPEVPLRRRYYANLVDIWVKTWREDEKTLSRYRGRVDMRTRARIDVLRADRNELFSRFSFDLSRYERKRLPAQANEPEDVPPPKPIVQQEPIAQQEPEVVPPPSPVPPPVSEEAESTSPLLTTKSSEPPRAEPPPPAPDPEPEPEVVEPVREPATYDDDAEPVQDEVQLPTPGATSLSDEIDPVPEY